MTSFVGRRDEIGVVKRKLAAARCVTLTGAGGVGKTRLALKVTSGVHRTFHDQVCFIELGQLREATLLPSVVADALGLRDQSSRPALDMIVDHLRDRELLLLLDNCEHLIDEVAELVNVLLPACPGLHVIATSRQSLGIPGESVFAVPPLPVPPLPGDGSARSPSPDSLRQYDSVQLFLDRATAVLPDYQLTTADAAALARLCRHLDGIPLALELAAVAMRSRSLAHIETRLSNGQSLSARARGVPERHQALRNLIDWSYDLCTDQERLAWARTSVFTGTFDLETVEGVTGDGALHETEVLDLVDSLVDKSILLREEHQGTVRYRLLEIFREYGQEKLVAAGQQEPVRRRLRDWYAGLVERFSAEWMGPDQVTWIDRVTRDHANLRAALDFCAVQPGEEKTGLRMAVQLHEYWSVRGFHTEARYWLDRLLPAVPEATPERLSALRLDGWFALMQGDVDAVQAFHGEAAELAQQLGAVAESAHLAHARGMCSLVADDFDGAETLFREALSLFRTAEDRRGESLTLFHLGVTMGINGKRERGLAALAEAVATSMRFGEVYWRSWALWGTAEVEALHGGLDRAEQAGKSALRLLRSLDNRFTMAFTLDTLGSIAALRDQHTRAATLFGCAAAVWQAIGTSADNFGRVGTEHHQHVNRARRELGNDAYDRAFERGSSLATDSAIDYALESCPKTGHKRGKPARADKTPPAEHGDEGSLTRRERQIAELVAQGYTNKAIAKRLFISQRTAEAHVENILVKRGFTSRTQVAAWVIETAHSPFPREDRGSGSRPE